MKKGVWAKNRQSRAACEFMANMLIYLIMFFQIHRHHGLLDEKKAVANRLHAVLTMVNESRKVPDSVVASCLTAASKMRVFVHAKGFCMKAVLCRCGLWLAWMPMLLFMVSPAAAQSASGWSRIDSRHFTLYADKNLKAAQQLSEQLELFHELALHITGVRVPEAAPPLPVFLASSPSRFQWLANVDSKMTIGVYRRGMGGDRMAVVKYWGDKDESMQVLFHEYVHDLMLYSSTVNYPFWYSEGFPEYLAQVDLSVQRARFGLPNKTHIRHLGYLTWQPFRRLMNRQQSRGVHGYDGFYAQSWLAVHFFMSDPQRRALLVDYLKRYNETGDQRAAYEATFAQAFINLDSELARYHERGLYAYTELQRNNAPVTRANPAPVSENAMHAWWAHAYLDIAMSSSCLGVFQAWLKHDPSNAEAQAGLAACHAASGDFSQVSQVQLPDDASQAARLRQAVALLQAAQEADPSAEATQSRVEAAQHLAMSVVRENKHSGKAIALLAETARWRGDLTTAANLYEAAAVYVPYDMGLVLGEAEVRVALGERERAGALLRRLQQQLHWPLDPERLQALETALGSDAAAEVLE